MSPQNLSPSFRPPVIDLEPVVGEAGITWRDRSFFDRLFDEWTESDTRETFPEGRG